MTITATPHFYEVNLYCEMTYPEHKTPQERYELGLCDYNLIFLTELDESASLKQLIGDAEKRFNLEMSQFCGRKGQEPTNATFSFSVEYHYPQEDGIHQPDEDELLVKENEAPFSRVEED